MVLHPTPAEAVAVAVAGAVAGPAAWSSLATKHGVTPKTCRQEQAAAVAKAGGSGRSSGRSRSRLQRQEQGGWQFDVSYNYINYDIYNNTNNDKYSHTAG